MSNSKAIPMPTIPTPPLDLAALRKVCDWADRLAPGPWFISWTGDGGDEESAGIDFIRDVNGDEVIVADSGVYPPHGKVASFIATARSALPAALDEIARLRGLLGEACSELDDTGGEFAKVEAARIRTAGGLSDE